MTGLLASGAARADPALWAGISSGSAVVMMRHALAPGTGDPAGFDVDDCSTQRNLSKEGREQARAIGDRFRKNGIDSARVLSSAWCRCLETARNLKLGPAENLPALNSFFGNRERRDPQTAALKAWLAENAGGETPVVLVTHQVNITALTGIYPRSGEMVVLRAGSDGEIEVLGRL
ncbi:phosphohistidine phosphatase SixA [Rhodobium orientis]|uniref:histidine phosphatase family protein n=1 Tax=Rhodobium orientis TaxID=34017 RepID=UPI001849A9BD|nr:histidine phosphatase family protein [Rhodobium orientis]MBB4304966.1 phosphohistidine phosphatase SixA [Rhodobium orientis]